MRFQLKHILIAGSPEAAEHLFQCFTKQRQVVIDTIMMINIFSFFICVKPVTNYRQGLLITPELPRVPSQCVRDTIFFIDLRHRDKTETLVEVLQMRLRPKLTADQASDACKCLMFLLLVCCLTLLDATLH